MAASIMHNGAAQIARRFISRPYARISQIFDLEKATALIWRKQN